MRTDQLTAPPARSRRSLRALVVVPVLLVLFLLAVRTIASYVIEYQWWQETEPGPHLARPDAVRVRRHSPGRRCSPLRFCLGPTSEE